MRKKKKIETLQEIINTPVGNSESGGFLTQLWRNYLIETNLDSQINLILYEFLKNVSEGLDPRIKSTSKVQVMNMLTNEKMTFKIFHFLMTEFMNNEEVELLLNVKSKEHGDSSHSIKLYPKRRTKE